MTEEKKPFKILCIDGGGIKGLYSASVIACLEEKANKRSGECFNMICGTSTGGIIALGLASGKSARELAELYSKNGNKIFPTPDGSLKRYWQRNILHPITQTVWRGKFSNRALKRVLTDTFGDLKLGELNNLVCIPSFNLVSGMPRVFKYPHEEGNFSRDGNIPVVDAALATSAAPTILPIHEYEDTLLVDGGLWANNPSLCGLMEAIMYFVGSDMAYSHVELLSVASISNANGWLSGVNKRRSFVGWQSKLIQIPMDGQAYFTHFVLDKAIDRIAPGSIYERIKSPQLSSEQMKVLAMDRADKKAVSTLRSLGDQEGHTYANHSKIIKFYQSLKTYNTNG